LRENYLQGDVLCRKETVFNLVDFSHAAARYKSHDDESLVESVASLEATVLTLAEAVSERTSGTIAPGANFTLCRIPIHLEEWLFEKASCSLVHQQHFLDEMSEFRTIPTFTIEEGEPFRRR
jgi:histidinol-phosphate/aromatic aminotransferase/cobyric acid decarboxylase-like protein